MKAIIASAASVALAASALGMSASAQASDNIWQDGKASTLEREVDTRGQLKLTVPFGQHRQADSADHSARLSLGVQVDRGQYAVDGTLAPIELAWGMTLSGEQYLQAGNTYLSQQYLSDQLNADGEGGGMDRGTQRTLIIVGGVLAGITIAAVAFNEADNDYQDNCAEGQNFFFCDPDR